MSIALEGKIKLKMISLIPGLINEKIIEHDEIKNKKHKPFGKACSIVVVWRLF